MSKTLTALATIGVIGAIVLVVIGGWIANSYNGFVQLTQEVEAEWSNVEVQYQRRADLIPQLVATVKGAAGFEKSTYIDVTEARTKWLNAQGGDREDVISAAQGMDSALSRLLVTVENYPDLKATANFQGLQAQLEGTENRVAVARRKYNGIVKVYNTSIKQFPGVFLANIFGFDEKAFFEASAGSENAPEVNFDN